MSDYVLEADTLIKDFSGFRAVSNVSLAVERGSIHALIGPNGAGKTTCFNLLTKFLEPSSGTIRLNGRDITRHKSDAVARLGMVRSFQISAIFRNLTVFENVRLAVQRRRGGSYVGRIVELIRAAAKGRTVLMVEHNLRVVADLCDRITVLARGEILAQGDYLTVSKDARVVEAYIGGGDHAA